MKPLDDKDLRLIAALRKNSRASLVSLGREIDLSRSATHDRITRLEEIGVIQAYTILVKPEVMPAVCAFLTIILKGGVENKMIVNEISEKMGIKSTYCLSGAIDMFVYCEFDHVKQLGELRNEISLISGVLEIQTRNILSSTGG